MSGVLWRSKSRPPHFSSKTLQGSCVYGTPGGVQGGSVCTRETSRAGGRHEHPRGSAAVRVVAEDDPEDDAVFAAARLRAEKAGGAAEAGSVAGHHRPDSGGGPVATEEAASHGEAHLRPAQGRARFARRLHHREGLRAPSAATAQGSVRAAWLIRPETRRRTSGKRWW